MMSVITAIVGYLAANPERNLPTLLALLIGTSLSAGAAGVLNQWLEREVDRRMVRTRNRPLPSGTVSAQAALAYGLVLAVAGPLVLWWGANSLAALLAVITLVSYLLVYTPLKQHSSTCTLVGAIPGALPPLIGSAAANQGSIDALGWALFAILFTWQIPHFMAIAWTHRRDYQLGQMRMATVIDPTGQSAARQAVVFAWLYLVAALLPWWLGATSYWLYPLAALAVGFHYLYQAYQFARPAVRDSAARKLFFSSIAGLPLLLAVLVVDCWLLT